MVGGLIVLIAKRVDSIRLESMVFLTFGGPQMVMEREPEEELHLWRHGGPPDEHGSRQRSHAKEECSIRRGGGVVSAWCPLPDVVVSDLWRQLDRLDQVPDMDVLIEYGCGRSTGDIPRPLMVREGFLTVRLRRRQPAAMKRLGTKL